MSFQTRQLCAPAEAELQGAPLALSPAGDHAHTAMRSDGHRRLRSARTPPPLAPSSSSSGRPPRKLLTRSLRRTVCGWYTHTHTHTHTQWPLLVAGERRRGTAARPHGTRTARAAAAAARGFPARPRYDPAPHNTSRDTRTDPHRPHRVAWPAHLGPRLCILSHSRPHTLFATPLPARCTLPQPSPPYWRSYWRSQGHPSWGGGGGAPWPPHPPPPAPEEAKGGHPPNPTPAPGPCPGPPGAAQPGGGGGGGGAYGCD